MSPKIALITGANKGIGFATAKKLGQMGYQVLLGARDSVRGNKSVDELRKAGMDAHLLLMELTNASSVSAAAKEVETRFKRLDVLINNAASMDYDNAAYPLDITRMREEFEVNFFSTVDVTNKMLPLMLRTSDAPRIVFVSTPLASHETVERPHNKYGSPIFTAYKCSKSAVNMYAHNLAYWLEHNADQVGGSARAAKVNVAYPGYVKTDMSFHTEEANFTPEEGAETSVYLATLPADGPNGGFFHLKERIPW